jgi:hypothetical protein
MRIDQCPGFRAAAEASAEDYKPEFPGSLIGEGSLQQCPVIENGHVCPVRVQALSPKMGIRLIMTGTQNQKDALCGDNQDSSLPKQKSFLSDLF